MLMEAEFGGLPHCTLCGEEDSTASATSELQEDFDPDKGTPKTCLLGEELKTWTAIALLWAPLSEFHRQGLPCSYCESLHRLRFDELYNMQHDKANM